MTTFHLEDDFNFPIEDKSYEELVRALKDMYNQLATSINDKPDLVVRGAAPASSDYRFTIGTLWIDTSVPRTYQLTSRTNATTAVWTALN
jgi:hypothetical protein